MFSLKVSFHSMKLVKTRHPRENGDPELRQPSQITGLSAYTAKLISKNPLRGNDMKWRFLTFYEAIINFQWIK
ncbi:MAG: hypothetical protein SCH71_13170 [Desulfobulbaceae bacterium]|nr:hypothetical protein [Desulfobulbaceae bacterium]